MIRLPYPKQTIVSVLFYLVPVILAVGLTACRSSYSTPAMAPLAADTNAGGGAFDDESAMVTNEGYVAELTESIDDATAQLAAAPGYQDGVTLARKIIARATMTIVVEETETVVQTIQQDLAALGGYVAQANLYRSSYDGDERLQGTLTLRIPAAALETIMENLEARAVTVRDKTINREDVTDQYSDVQARLRNLEATENELREMLAEVRAKPNATPEDILTVYRHLTDIRGQIEQAQGRKNMFDNLVSLSTLELTLIPNWTTRPVVEEGWQPGYTLRNASRELVSALQDLADLGIWFVIFLLPILLLLAVPIFFIIWLIRLTVRWLRRKWRGSTVKEPTRGTGEE